MNDDDLKTSENMKKTPVVKLDGLTSDESKKKEEISLLKKKQTYTIKLCRDWKIGIYKPLIPLKMVLFIWFGGGSLLVPFLTVFLKQRGMTLAEVSVLYIITPIVQTLGPVIAGIIADKIGRPKPVLIANILLSIAAIGILLLVPRINSDYCKHQLIKLNCHPEFDYLVANSKSNISTNNIQLESCRVNCPNNVTEFCTENNLICELSSVEQLQNISLSANLNHFYKLDELYYYNISSVMYKNSSYSWCNKPPKMNCEMNCSWSNMEDCSGESGSRLKLVVAYYVVLVLFYTFFSNSYRFLDVTSMALVKEHNSDYGKERFFSISGILVFSSLAGYVVDATTVEGAEKNYDSVFYLFLIMVVPVLAAVSTLKVQTIPPGKKMWRKTINMMKNPDILSFVLILLILGTAWGFTKIFMFWYLETLNAPSILMGLLPAASALYGLPFLLTSNWWVDKIGPKNIFVLALVAYVLNAVGYSFLYDPWLAILLELTCILTYHLLWVSVIRHSHDIAPEGMRATVIATAGGIHYSIGKGTGSLIGGLVMSKFGGRVAFRLIAIICLASAILYALFLYMRYKCLKNVKKIDNSNVKDTQEGQIDIYTLTNKCDYVRQ